LDVVTTNWCNLSSEALSSISHWALIAGAVSGLTVFYIWRISAFGKFVAARALVLWGLMSGLGVHLIVGFTALRIFDFLRERGCAGGDFAPDMNVAGLQPALFAFSASICVTWVCSLAWAISGRT
jgi:hypothetical protein